MSGFFIAKPFIGLVFLAVMFTAYRLRNEMIADIIVAILLTSWIVGDTVVKAILLIDTNADILEIIYYIFARPWVYFYLFTLSGILAKIYFSRYYGVIISKTGIALILLEVLIISPVIAFKTNRFGEELFYAIYFGPGFYLDITFSILFYALYFKLLSNTKIDLKITPKNDPKDW